jgi:hypothetical protein
MSQSKPKRKLVEEAGPTVRHVNLSRSRNGRSRKKREDEYVIGIVTPTTSAANQSTPPQNNPGPSTATLQEVITDYHALQDSLVVPSSDYPSEFPSSDVPELYNGLHDPSGNCEVNSHAGSAGEEEFIHQMKPLPAPKRKRLRVNKFSFISLTIILTYVSVSKRLYNSG